MTRRTAVLASIMFTFGLLVGSAATMVSILAVYLVTRPSIEDLKQRGDGIVTAIETFNAEHHQFPQYLEDAGIYPAHTRFGDWRYRVDENTQQYTLSIGDYSGWDPFTLSWSSDRRAWYLDD